MKNERTRLMTYEAMMFRRKRYIIHREHVGTHLEEYPSSLFPKYSPSGGTNLNSLTDFCWVPRHLLRLDGVEDEDVPELEVFSRVT